MSDNDWGPLLGLMPFVLVAAVLGLVLILRGFFVLEPRTAYVIMYWGKYSRTLMTAGIHWAFPIGLSWRRVSLRDRVFQSPLTTVVDAVGNPIQVSAVSVFRVVEPARAVLEVQDFAQFVANQASTVLKAVCSRYPYESRDPSQPSLKQESDAIMAALAGQLQSQVSSAGVEILLVRLNDLAYAPEIAQSMLLRQQAQALVDARRTLLEGAVATVQDGIQRLELAQIRLSPVRRNHLIGNLTLLLCAGERGEQHSTVVSRQR
jgi:regulator of protease activity HflC (stomatin/prohibitin superfamily)